MHRTCLRTACTVLLATSAAALSGASFADGFHFDSICRSDPAANKNTVTVVLHGPDLKVPDGTYQQDHTSLADVTINVLWNYVDYRQNHADFKYRRDSCLTHSDGSCTFSRSSGRARWQLTEVVGYEMSSPAFDDDNFVRKLGVA
jgi:hypothetical protein